MSLSRVIVMSICMLFTAAAGAATPERVERLANFEKAYKSAGTLRGLLKQAEPGLDFDDYRFLREKIESRRQPDEKLPVLRRKGPAEFEYEARGMIVRVSWDDDDRLSVNRQKLELGDERTADAIFERVVGALPKKSAGHPLRPLLLPEAEAALDMISTALGIITTLNELLSAPGGAGRPVTISTSLRAANSAARAAPTSCRRRSASAEVTSKAWSAISPPRSAAARNSIS